MDIEKELDELAELLKQNKLNLLEEAQAVNKLQPKYRHVHGYSLVSMAKRLGKTYRWMRQRIALLKMPEEVQQAAAQGIFTLSDLALVATLKKSAWNRNSIRVLADRKRGLVTHIHDIRHKYTRKKTRQIKDMMVYLSQRGIGGLSTRLLAWTVGTVTSKEIYADINEFLEKRDGQNNFNSPS